MAEVMATAGVEVDHEEVYQNARQRMLQDLKYERNVLLRVDELRVCSSAEFGAIGYQREEKTRWIRKAFKAADNTFSELLAGTIYVGRRVDDTKWIADGRQRVGIARLAGREEVSCLVFESSGPKMEADVFLALDNRTKLGKQVTFNAGLVSGDPLCLEIMQICKDAGYTLDLQRENRSKYDASVIGCPVAVMDIHKKYANLSPLLDLVRGVWPDQADGVRHEALCGLAQFMYYYPEMNGARLWKVLREQFAEYFFKKSKTLKTDFGNNADSRANCFTQVVVEAYNSRRKEANRLPSFYTRKKEGKPKDVAPQED